MFSVRCRASFNVPAIMNNALFNGHHLSAGSEAPPLTKGKLRLYSMRFCPFAQRVHLVLDAKKIPYDTVYVNLTTKPEWLFEKNPQGKVPAIELEDGTVLHESLLLSEYLDSLSAHRPLVSKDPLQRIKDKLLIERFSQFVSLFYKILLGSRDAQYAEDVLKTLDDFEAELSQRKSSFFNGNEPGMVDYMVWPYSERHEMLVRIAGSEYALQESRFPKLVRWQQLMRADEAVKASVIDTPTHMKFVESKIRGTTNYDLLVSQL